MTARRGGHIVAVDLFCGAGGLTNGLVRAGIRVVRGIDSDISARDTYERNNLDSEFVHGDIRHIGAAALLGGIDLGGSELMLAGCAPCQPFSRHVADSKGDRRRSLMARFAALVREIRPDHVLAENVPLFVGSASHKRMIRALKECGYSYDDDVVDAADYGVPQHRRRYVLLASRKIPVSLPAPTHGPSAESEWRTVRDAIAAYPAVAHGKSHDGVPNHTASGLSEKNARRMSLTPWNGGSRMDVRGMTLKCHRGHNGHSDVYGRMKWDRPAPTLTCRCNSISNGRFAHPDQDRGMTIREAAAIQTFPDDYVFHGTTMERNAAHVGNAVPILMAERLGAAFV